VSRPPTVSVVVPTHNGARYVAATLASALAQRGEDLEVLVCDDASSDATAAVVARFGADPRLRVVPPAGQLGAVANWNRGLAAARGRYVTVLCQDDLLLAGCLSAQLSALAAYPGSVLCAVGRRVVGPSGRVYLPRVGSPLPTGRHDRDRVLGACLRRATNVLGEPSALLLDRAAALKVGGFRPCGYVSDLDLWLRMLELGDAAVLSRTLVAFRVHQESWSYRLGSEQSGQVQALLRRAAAAGGVRLDPGALARRAGARRVARGLLYAAAGRSAAGRSAIRRVADAA
jgi:glycosyltransferase involved in cell wall biosynthesis